MPKVELPTSPEHRFFVGFFFVVAFFIVMFYCIFYSINKTRFVWFGL